MNWLNDGTSGALDALRQLRIGPYGELIAVFSQKPTDGGPEVEVQVRIDHELCVTSTDRSIWINDNVWPLRTRFLQQAADGDPTSKPTKRI